jgi:hypothetical protein
MIPRLRTITLIALPLLLSACESTTVTERGDITQSPDTIDRSDPGAVLDAWHHAASVGDIESYFGSTTEGFVFLGTDAAERWTRNEFRAFAEPHFADGHGWTYRPIKRFISTNSYGDVAWVDEVLEHDTYGTMRGTAVLRSLGYDDDWRIAHYSLSFLVPNDAVDQVVKINKQFDTD